jgi:CDP-diacylglycerol--serine O-phosphatidyltransferase
MYNIPLNKKWIYVLPNVFTTFTLSAGFYSIIMAAEGQYNVAAISIFIAFFADGFDGFVARLTNTQSQFGAEYDSFSDLIAFGVAPAFLAYVWSISILGKYSWIIGLCYVIATAIRLARFNVQSKKRDKTFFNGLPSPISAGMIVSTLYLFHHYAIHGLTISYFLAGLSILLSGLMISTIRYYSIRAINSRIKWILFILTLLIVIALTMNMRPEGFFCLFFIYVISAIFIKHDNISKEACI